MTKGEKLISIKNQAEIDGRNGKISVAEAQRIVAQTENIMAMLTVAELGEEVKEY